ncbi:hypothetical protein J7K41_01225 [Candidatus Micrarchaeota archaeon]|nr:hypothetical protein [Candidatus Micrarchaeota archaeon]
MKDDQRKMYEMYGLQIQHEIEQREAFLQDLIVTIEAVRTMKEQNILFPVGRLVYGHAKVTDPDTFIVPVGGGYMVKKRKDELVEHLNRIVDLEVKHVQVLSQNLNAVVDKLRSMNSDE